ncbi:sigma-70 family RNA polymerase sigma factor [Streptomyces sp. NPDC020362]|uniref:RNA polymerase sigma factor n=1 Tax=unclassified Streptomyces TaxID=2593676 RepID=UPI000A969728
MTEQQAAPHAEAVAALVVERYGQLVGYARRRLRAFDVPLAWVDAEDVVQNALLSVLTRSKSIGKLRPYVFTVIKNEAWHATQRYRCGQAYGSRDADVQLEATGPAVDPCGTADLRLDLSAALSALPAQQRTAVFCTKVLGLTQAETARAMDKSPGTVATHTSRAVATLKLALGALAVALVGCATQWLRSGTWFVQPAAGGGLETLLAQGSFIGLAVAGSLAVTAVVMLGVVRLRRLLAPVRDRVWRLLRSRFARLLEEPQGRAGPDPSPSAASEYSPHDHYVGGGPMPGGPAGPVM